jgi:predicted anti-sigma-YlaC factor YlaD
VEKGTTKMKRAVWASMICGLGIALSGCSIRQAAMNSVSDMLAPPPEKAAPEKKTDAVDPMIALTGENDPQLVAEFFPTALKLYEIMHLQNPEHEGLALMAGQLYVTYANAFVQGPAERLPPAQFDEQNAEYLRAQNFYLRGMQYALKALDNSCKGFILSINDNAAFAQKLAKLKKKDAAALFWAGSGALGAFSISPLDTELLSKTGMALAMLERAAELDPSFNNGAIFEVLMAFYAAALEPMGGGMDKALAAYEKALAYSNNKSPSVHIGYARSFCIPAQNSAGFDEAIAKALAIEPDSFPENRLALILAQKQAVWLRDNKARFILE